MKKLLNFIFFYNTNLLKYNLFNFFYKILISKRKNFVYINDYLKNGIVKISSIDQNKINSINNEIELQKPSIKNFSQIYSINNEIKKNIHSIVNNDLKTVIEELEFYYQSKIKLSWAGITRNHSIQDESEYFSNFFHTDAYVFTMVKFFINLHDVDDNSGALELIPKNQKISLIKKMLKEFNTRIDPRTIKNKIKIKKNLGKKGELTIVKTTEYLHRAGNPKKNKTRDMLFLEFVVISKKQKQTSHNNSLYTTDYEDENNMTKEYSKPHDFKSIYKLFISYF